MLDYTPPLRGIPGPPLRGTLQYCCLCDRFSAINEAIYTVDATGH